MLEEFDVISILGNTITSTTYKVKNKANNQVCVWQTVSYNSEKDKKQIIKKIEARKHTHHPNLLQFYSYLDQKNSKLLYITTEYCSNGSLKQLIDDCSNKHSSLEEDFICKLIYQIACTLRTINNFQGNLSSKHIFLDDDYNVKLYNYNSNIKPIKLKMSQMGILTYELCTLKSFDKALFEKDLKVMSQFYSNSLITLITLMVKDNSDLFKNLNNILCHPTILLKSSKWNKSNCFTQFDNTLVSDSNSDKYSDKYSEITSESYLSKLENLKNREAILKLREQKLIEKERKLLSRKKNIILMEKMAEDKITKAKLSLKCCENNCANGYSSKCSISDSKKDSSMNLDSTYLPDCGDSVIGIPTSKKMDVTKIPKPIQFSSNISSKQIRFKGHSPLKEFNFIKRRSLKHSKVKKSKQIPIESIRGTENLYPNQLEEESNRKKAKQLFTSHNIYENDILYKEIDENNDCRPISWTDEHKKQAFELLRLMSSVTIKENKSDDLVKHTYL